MKFSVVLPLKDETETLTRTLPSIYAVNPDEVILCFDDPAHAPTLAVAKDLATKNDHIRTRFLEVKRNPKYKFHQAWVRRKGFLEAIYNRILTVDVDLVINKNVIKALEIVGKNNVGFCSLQKFLYPTSPLNLWRVFTTTFLIQLFRFHRFYQHRISSHTPFTGLYALYRPFWLDSEDDGIKTLVNPKQKVRGETVNRKMSDAYVGEDTYLHNCLVQKHRCVYLSDIAAVCLNTNLEDIPDVQKAIGIYHAQQGRSLQSAVLHAFLHGRTHYLPAYIEAKRFLKA